MKRINTIFITVLMLGILSSLTTYAQRFRFTSKKQYVSWGVNLNTSHYFGDIAPTQSMGSTDFSKTRPSIGGFIQKRLTPRVTGRIMFTELMIEGDDANANTTGHDLFRVQRNLHFRNFISELSFMGIVDLFKNEGVYYRRPKVLIPYLSAGIAVFHHMPQAKDSEGNWTSLRPLKTEGVEYSPIAISIPLGIGFRYKLTGKIDIGMEFIVRYALTDYLDDVSSNSYVPSDEFGSPEALEFAFRAWESGEGSYWGDVFAGEQPSAAAYDKEVVERAWDRRGNPNNNDVYMSMNLQMNYILGRGLKTPKFR